MKSYRQYRGKRNRVGKFFAAAAAVLMLAVLVYGALLGAVLSGKYDEVNGDPQVMIVLGCQVMPSGQPSVLLKDRLDTALEWLEVHPDMTVVVSGGQGFGEPISEAEAMADYLMQKGVSEENILLEGNSFSTWENLKNSTEMLVDLKYDNGSNVLVVSNGFHLARIRMLWQRLGGDFWGLSTLSAPCSHAPSEVRMCLREPLAFLKSLVVDWR